MATKEKLYSLIDQLPDGELHAAERYLEYLRDLGDPLLRQLLLAPLDDERESDKEKDAIAEAYRDLEENRTVSQEEVRRRLLGSS